MRTYPDRHTLEHTLSEKLIESAKSGKEFMDVLESIRKDSPAESAPHALLLHSLCDMDFSEQEGKEYVDEVLRNKTSIESKLGRHISFQVALLDHIMNNGHRMLCPKIVDLKTFEEQTTLIMVDPLTGLYNRRYADSILSRELDRAKRFNLQLSILFTDIDNFKQVNDNFGHGTGDAILKEFGGILQESLRTHDVAARYGGEEFVIIMPETAESGAKIYGERFLERCRTHAFPKDLKITFSGGISAYPSHGDSPESIMEQADIGLYYSKAKGKNQITILEHKKRNAVRYPTEINMQYFCDQLRGRAKTKDLSISGVSFITQAPLQVGETLDLTLKFPSTAGELEVGAQIVWIRQGSPEKDFFFGAKFNKLKPEVVRMVRTASASS